MREAKAQLQAAIQLLQDLMNQHAPTNKTQHEVQEHGEEKKKLHAAPLNGTQKNTPARATEGIKIRPSTTSTLKSEQTSFIHNS